VGPVFGIRRKWLHQQYQSHGPTGVENNSEIANRTRLLAQRRPLRRTDSLFGEAIFFSCRFLWRSCWSLGVSGSGFAARRNWTRAFAASPKWQFQHDPECSGLWEYSSEKNKGVKESAGLNRLGIGNERVLQRRPSQLLWPRTVRCWW